MKKILILVLSAILVLSSSVCAFALETGVDPEEQEIRNKLESLRYEVVSLTKSEESINQENDSKYTPFLALNGISCWQNISFDFKAQWYPLAGYYILVPDSVKNIKSHLSGLIGVDWYQTNAVANYTDPTGLTTDIQVLGYYLFGVRIGSYDAGLKKEVRGHILQRI